MFCEINFNVLITILSFLLFRYVVFIFNIGIYSDYISFFWYICSKVVIVWVLGFLLIIDYYVIDYYVYIFLLYL